MISFVRKVLETYLRERRVLTAADFTADDLIFANTKNAVFITLYFQGKVIASQGRIACKTENSLTESLDLTLSCLKDPRFSANFQNLELLPQISIRVDTFDNSMRRQLKNIFEITASEGLIFLSPSLGKMSVILPNMIAAQTPEKILDFAKQKAGVETDENSFLYALRTNMMQE